jgi:diguanylate cyclase (GGDEF)-like protein
MKILIVDSDKLVARLMQSKFEKWGHSVVIESDGLAAFEAVKKEPFRMVILDWDLPGMMGPDLCKAIRKLKRDRYTYIVFYTAMSDKDSLMAGLESGADVYLTKPLNTIELWLRLKNGKRMLNLEDELREGPGADRVTGAVNAASFAEFFRVIHAENVRTDSRGVLMYVTVNNYKSVFAEFGYTPAQTMMIEAAKVMERNTRQADLLARISDNQFCLMLQNTWWDHCRGVADKIDEQLRSITIYHDEISLGAEFSIEVSDYPQGEMSHDNIMTNGKRVAYQPKAARKAPAAL